MEPESSLPYSKAPATCPYPEPNPSSAHNPFPLPEDPSQYYLFLPIGSLLNCKEKYMVLFRAVYIQRSL